jgi:hypothetical protein
MLLRQLSSADELSRCRNREKATVTKFRSRSLARYYADAGSGQEGPKCPIPGHFTRNLEAPSVAVTRALSKVALEAKLTSSAAPQVAQWNG